GSGGPDGQSHPGGPPGWSPGARGPVLGLRGRGPVDGGPDGPGDHAAHPAAEGLTMTAGVREALKPWLRRLALRHALTTLGSAAAWSLAAAWPGLVLDRILVERTGLWLAGAAAILAASAVLVRGWSCRPGFTQAARAADAHAHLRQQAVTALAMDDEAGAAAGSPELAQLLALQR